MNMLNKIDHVGIAVNSLSQVKELFKTILGLTPTFEEEVPDQKVRVAGFRLGDSSIEFLEPLSDDSPISNFLKKRGEGLHHICYEVQDIEEILAIMKRSGLRLIDETPRIGAGGKKIAFVHPKSMNGVLVELSESPSSMP